jgi:hypothetical protein
MLLSLACPVSADEISAFGSGGQYRHLLWFVALFEPHSQFSPKLAIKLRNVGFKINMSWFISPMRSCIRRSRS